MLEQVEIISYMVLQTVGLVPLRCKSGSSPHAAASALLLNARCNAHCQLWYELNADADMQCCRRKER